MNNYQYPLDLSWSTEEMATVIAFFTQVEEFYEKKVDKKFFMSSYKKFKEVVPSKGQEKQLDKEFEKLSGYSSYRALKSLSKDEN
ncbi:MAG: UPF0223 family protein [Lactovum sp.]